MFSTRTDGEPRFQINDTPDTQLIFGVDVDGARPGAEIEIDANVLGYPLDTLLDVSPGEYTVQALFHKYQTFTRADGHVVKLPMDRGEGQQWNRAPGNLYSTPRRVTFDPRSADTLRIALDKVIPPIPDPPATKYIRHERILSERLTKFWGREIYLGAHVLLPEGFDAHPDAKYPLVIDHGHFPYTIDGFREAPPDPTVPCEYSARFKWDCYNRTEQEYAHQFYRDWTSAAFPRFLLIEIQHANPYYDDSYAVNSENLGPYGDAITYELIPYLEKKYRGLGAGWARFMYGGSTGGWEAMGVQVKYPDEYNGAYAACPDPIDFRAFSLVDLYADRNAYYTAGPWRKVKRPGYRDYLGKVTTFVEDMNRLELVLGTRGRSGGQWDIWQAVYSPVGADGYPRPIWNKLTGEIDPEVAAHWRDNYDLSHILRRDWDHGARPAARRQVEHLRRRHGQLLPQQRGVPRRGLPPLAAEPGVRRRDHLRRPGRALLERRSVAAQRDLAAALRADVRAEDRRPHPEDRPAWRRHHVVALLTRRSRACRRSATAGHSSRRML